ncbi:hypothetical protein LGR54_23405 [Ancylobacter sp. Lp-2]|uniref:hypothetical protein n=1 Tax=Ancylobacter sp. Lp-2 TaxID=2881339 RepID=UPI001E4C6CE2|nr:hypothetical protein [Ancylobacter sp. Lp-2]MCB4771562.1 hypothetical protein [Ancylobacter sp. Lp-2]
MPVKDLLGSTLLADAAPKIVTLLEPEGGPPTRSVTRMQWDAPTRDVDLGVVEFKPGGAATRLKTEVVVTKRLDDPTTGPTLTISGRLDEFSVTLLNVVRVNFNRFSFGSASGQSPSVDVALDEAAPFEFLGALKFVQSLSEIIPPGIFGANGPRITLQPTSIEVGFALPLPPAAFGVFSIRNIAIGTSLVLPFLTGRPSLAFSFASREKPFQLSVLILGGGGFARVELDTEGIRSVEVMFEFGGMFSLDVGVASGSVHILAGIYIGLKGTDSELTGYVRVGGEVTILAIVSISIEFMLSLSYYPAQRVAKGVAKVTVSVRVAFISKSVSFSVERSFEAGSRHLSIAEAMGAGDWADYAEAFA